MKCVKDVKTGTISRVDNTLAIARVKSGKFAYCSKTEWKREVRDVGKEKK